MCSLDNSELHGSQVSRQWPCTIFSVLSWGAGWGKKVKERGGERSWHSCEEGMDTLYLCETQKVRELEGEWWGITAQIRRGLSHKGPEIFP